MEEIRILGIAPFESIRAAMERVAREEFPAVRFEAYTGDLEEGVKIAQRLSKENYDVVISRGGTAELLKKETTLPVVEITFSVYDILRAEKLVLTQDAVNAIHERFNGKAGEAKAAPKKRAAKTEEGAAA